MRTTAQVRALWNPACTEHREQMRVAYRALDNVMAKWGYRPRAGVTGAANCRHITGGSGYSLHAYFDGGLFSFWTGATVTMAVAVDVNWDKNPYGRRLVTDMPRGMVDEILAIRTTGDVPVWGWGGNYSGNKDAMHFEILASAHELAAGVVVHGGPPPTTPPEVHPVTGSTRVALVPIGTGLVAYFADGGAWASPGTGHTAAEWSVHDAVAARGGKVTSACALAGGVAVLSEDGHIDTRFAVPVGEAT